MPEARPPLLPREGVMTSPGEPLLPVRGRLPEFPASCRTAILACYRHWGGCLLLPWWCMTSSRCVALAP
ncbi:hypothetical protein FKM82_005760 [Ascaphus truei]